MGTFYNLIIKQKKGYARVNAWAKEDSGFSRFDCSHEQNWCWHPVDTVRLTLRDSGSEFGPTLVFDDFLILSESLFNYFKTNNFISDTEVYNVKIIEPIPKRFKNIAIPNYYIIDYRKIQGAKININNFPYPNPHYCKECGHLVFDWEQLIDDLANGKTKKFIIDENSWNGRDLISYGTSQIITNGRLICTERFKKIMEINYKNLFEFKEFGEMLD